MRTQKPLLLPSPLPPRSVPSHSSSCGRVSEGLFGVVPSLPPRRSPHIREMTPLPSHSTLQLCSALPRGARSISFLSLAFLAPVRVRSLLFRVPIRRTGLGIPFPPSFGSARLATMPLCHTTTSRRTPRRWRRIMKKEGEWGWRRRGGQSVNRLG